MRFTKLVTEYQAQIDRQAEAIGEAEDTFYAELLEQEPPTTRLRIEQDYRAVAIQRGLSLAKPRFPYAKMASIRAWERTCAKYSTAKTPVRHRVYLNKRHDRAYNAEVDSRRPAPGAPTIRPQHVKRVELYRERLRSGQLAILNAEALLTVPAAAQLSGVPERTMYKAAARGDLHTTPVVNGPGKPDSKLVAAGELRRFIQSLILPEAA